MEVLSSSTSAFSRELSSSPVLPAVREGVHGLGGSLADFYGQFHMVHVQGVGQLGVGRLAAVFAGQALQSLVDLAGLEPYRRGTQSWERSWSRIEPRIRVVQ